MNNLSIVRNKIPTPTQKAVIPKVGPGVLPDAAQKVGKDIKDATCVKEACEIAGLNWSVETQELVTPNGIIVPNKAVVRTDNQQVLGVVGSTYKPLQNSEAFDFFNDFVTSGNASFESAGSIGGGRRVFIQAKVNTEALSITGDDVVENYIMLGTSHDGSLAVSTGFFPRRVMCANILATQNFRAQGKMIKFRHTAKIHENLEQVAAIMNLANGEFEATAEQYKYLATQAINVKQLEELIKVVMIGDNFAEIEKEKGEEVGKRVVGQIVELFENGRGAEYTKDTYWKAYNAVNEYLCHERGADDGKRLDSIAFGQGATLNRRALNVALKLTA